MTNYAQPFSIRLTARQISELDSLVAYDGLSRQELIRRAVDVYLEDRRVKLLAQVNAQHAQIPAQAAQAQPAQTSSPAAPAPAVAATGDPAVEPPSQRPLKVARR